MLKFFRRSGGDKTNQKAEVNHGDKPEDNNQIAIQSDLSAQETKKSSLFKNLYRGLTKTRQQLFGGISKLFTGRVTIDDELFEELEDHLLSADVGIEVTAEILSDLSKEIKLKDSNDIESLKIALKQKLVSILQPCEQQLIVNKEQKPWVILVVGVNGAGKTTTIGKMAKQLSNDGHKIMLAAGDTFRAAAIEQLVTWGERNQVQVIAQQQGSDSASVIFDAYQSAKAKNIDVLIADTAGRLHTQAHLMQELAKIKRVMEKQQEGVPHEILLVLDAGMGQNALQQAIQFKSAIGLTGIAITKLDGTAKGGIIFAIARVLNMPIRYIGVGEGIDDLQQFNAEDFVSALLSS